ncbi:hypothetical protein B7H23_12780 [Notoacmeibacter marinus]|uniref:Prolyl 4-hydroxylase alpha subunit domain-containing protein n=1 Tax=Notoacmeibacter marinus TaxID=1876515 RepID=A0A231UUX0_9HYPH|nr:2OG-Fe(II) oxygenase [Notoacmeibacter marinus]OXS99075.1 hypothetical protein B7H23_12780 [Notoacmeibacter marinus]
MLRDAVSVRTALETNGFISRDDFLPDDTFRALNDRVLQSWEGGNGWRTRVKGPAEAKVLPLQPPSKTLKIRSLLDEQANGANSGFSYLYHSLHQENDDAGLIARISTAVIEEWNPVIKELIGKWDRTNFSLTAYTPPSFLDSHTDHDPSGPRYQITLLLYFGDAGKQTKQAGLVFDYLGRKSIIPATPNRAVLFVPSPETNHGIPRANVNGTPAYTRLAFSGWLI